MLGRCLIRMPASSSLNLDWSEYGDTEPEIQKNLLRERRRVEFIAREAKAANEPCPCFNDWRDIYARRAYWENVYDSDRIRRKDSRD